MKPKSTFSRHSIFSAILLTLITGCNGPRLDDETVDFVPPSVSLTDIGTISVVGSGVHHIILNVTTESQWFPDNAQYEGAGPKWHWVFPFDGNQLHDGGCEESSAGVLYRKTPDRASFGDEVYILRPGLHSLLVAIDGAGSATFKLHDGATMTITDAVDNSLRWQELTPSHSRESEVPYRQGFTETYGIVGPARMYGWWGPEGALASEDAAYVGPWVLQQAASSETAICAHPVSSSNIPSESGLFLEVEAAFGNDTDSLTWSGSFEATATVGQVHYQLWGILVDHSPDG